MESKKRPHIDSEDGSTHKKRIVSGENGSPHPNGFIPVHVLDVEEDHLNFEEFQKGALFRQMRQYARETQRSQVRIAELEHRKNTCEAGLAALSACWAQLVETIRSLARPEDLPLIDINVQKILGLFTRLATEKNVELTATLEDNMAATRNLVTKITQLGDEGQSDAPVDDAYAQCRAKCVALHAEVNTIRLKLEDSENQRQRLHDELIKSQTRADRNRSPTVHALGARSLNAKQEMKEERTEPHEAFEETRTKPSSPAPSTTQAPPVSGTEHSNTLIEWLEKRLSLVEKEAGFTRDRYNRILVEHKYLDPTKLENQPYYKVICEHNASLRSLVQDREIEIGRLQEELHALQLSFKEDKDETVNGLNNVIQDLKTMLMKRDMENTRLRDQRDQQAAEINERKQRDQQTNALLEETRKLADRYTERIQALLSELRRCRAQLAVNAGMEDLMKYFFGEDSEEQIAYVAELKQRVEAAESRVSALEQTLSAFQGDSPDITHHIQTEPKTFQKLNEATSQLAKYQAIYGELATFPPDVNQLATELRKKEAELERLRLIDIERNQTLTSLYAEVDKLSASWDLLDQQVKGKLSELSSLGDKLRQKDSERLKSENKFFAAMRDKDAIESERKILARNLEKQSKVIERITGSEAAQAAKVESLSKAFSELQKLSEGYLAKLERVELDLRQTRAHLEIEAKRSYDFGVSMGHLEREHFEKKSELRKLEERLVKEKMEFDQNVKRHEAHQPNTSNSTAEAQLREEIVSLENVIQCSTCKRAARNTVITKCMHTFCKECIDARISTRQRKCPYCGAVFAQSDVHTIFFQ